MGAAALKMPLHSPCAKALDLDHNAVPSLVALTLIVLIAGSMRIQIQSCHHLEYVGWSGSSVLQYRYNRAHLHVDCVSLPSKFWRWNCFSILDKEVIYPLSLQDEFSLVLLWAN